jgi:predicted nucleotidyltransferase
LLAEAFAMDTRVEAVREMRTLHEVIGQLQRMQPDLYRRYPIRQMGVFGSYARGEQTESSDVDIVVDVGDGIGLIELAGLQQDLSDALGAKVDLVVKDALKRRVGQRILSEAVML